MSFYGKNLLQIGTAAMLLLGITTVSSPKVTALGLDDVLGTVLQRGLSIEPELSILDEAESNTIQVCVILTCQPTNSIPSILGIPTTTSNTSTTNRTTTGTVPTTTTTGTIPTTTTSLPNTNGTVVRTTTTNTNGVPTTNTTVNGVPVNTGTGTVYGTTTTNGVPVNTGTVSR
jgi:hypothetical protein